METLQLAGIIVLCMEKNPAYKTGILPPGHRDESILLFSRSLWSCQGSPASRALFRSCGIHELYREESHLTLLGNSLHQKKRA